jgi:hypothetical protein
MDNEPNKEIETQETPSMEEPRRIRRIGIQVPLYRADPGKPSTQLSPDEYHDALERQRKYQISLKEKWMTPKNLVIGVVILSFDLAILQLLPYLVKMIGIHDPVLLGKWLIGLVGVVTVATLIYISSHPKVNQSLHNRNSVYRISMLDLSFSLSATQAANSFSLM